MLTYDRRAPGCRFVMRNAMMVHSCEFVRDFGALLSYYRNTIQKDTNATGSLGEFVGLSDVESPDEKTIRFRRFMGWGMCVENTVMTCNEPAVEHLAMPRCLMFEGTDRTDPEGTTEPNAYYYEGTSSIDDETNTSDYYPTSSDYEDDAQTNKSKITGELTGTVGIVLVVLGGLVLISMAAMCVFWSRLPRLPWKKGCKGLEMSIMAAKQEGNVAALEGKPPRGGKSCGVAKNLKGKQAGDKPETTKECRSMAVSEQTEGIEDSCAKIEEQIAAGGNGVVYKGTFKGMTVAIKTVVFQGVVDSTSRERQCAVFEAAISSSAEHKNIAQTYAYCIQRLESSALTTDFIASKRPSKASPATNSTQVMGNWKLFIVQEFCDGGSLQKCLDDRRLLGREGLPKLPALFKIGQGVASGLKHLHAHLNIVHGDLCSKNILLKKDAGDSPDALGVAKVADFGLSIKMGLLQSHISNQQAGSPFYIAPEVYQDAIMSKKADVFSFGVFLWELYHSKRCYYAADNSGLRYHPLFPRFPITCPIPYAMLCAVCISPDPRSRPDFGFVSRVLASLKKQADQNEFRSARDLRLKNMRIIAGLGSLTPGDILSVIADQVGIPLVDPLNAASSDDGSPSSDLIRSVAMTHPEKMFFCYDSQQAAQSGKGAMHLNQAFVSPWHCVLSVPVAKEHNPVAPLGIDEEVAISWRCDSAAEPAWQRSAPEDRYPACVGGAVSAVPVSADLSSQCWPWPITVTGDASTGKELVVDFSSASNGSKNSSSMFTHQLSKPGKQLGSAAGNCSGPNTAANVDAGSTGFAALDVPISVDVQPAFLLQHPTQGGAEECEDIHSGLLKGRRKSDCALADDLDYQFPKLA
eukprot:evm.model.scf_757EXC.2 EVM.evm.TU.scf_757EXC.2   scf_757EXC:16352-19790(-)